MKKALIFSVTAITLFFASTTVNAQEVQKSVKGERITRAEAADKAESRAQKLVERWNKDLSLDAAQQERIYGLALESFKSEQASMESYKKLELKLTDLLTPEQKIKKAEVDKQRQAEATQNKPQRILMKTDKRGEKI